MGLYWILWLIKDNSSLWLVATQMSFSPYVSFENHSAQLQLLFVRLWSFISYLHCLIFSKDSRRLQWIFLELIFYTASLFLELITLAHPRLSELWSLTPQSSGTCPHLVISSILPCSRMFLQVKSQVNPGSQLVCLLVSLISVFASLYCLSFSALKSLIYFSQFTTCLW